MKLTLPSFNITVKPIHIESVSQMIIKTAIICIPFGLWKIAEILIALDNHFHILSYLK